jgi:hypothetical protein
MKFLLPLGLLAGTWAIAAAPEEPHTTSTSGNAPTAEPRYVQDVFDMQDPLQMGAMPVMDVAHSPRHRQEKAHLMKRMDRKHGKWGTMHPRHRLLESLFGFTKYRETTMAELQRWRDLYKSVGKKQKKVCELKTTDESLLILCRPWNMPWDTRRSLMTSRSSSTRI